MYRLIAFILIASALQSCASSDTRVGTMQSEFALTYPEPQQQARLLTGSIMDNGNSLYPAGRAYKAGSVEIGDIVTVILN